MHRHPSSVPHYHGQRITARLFAACITEALHRVAVAEETVSRSFRDAQLPTGIESDVCIEGR